MLRWSIIYFVADRKVRVLLDCGVPPPPRFFVLLTMGVAAQSIRIAEPHHGDDVVVRATVVGAEVARCAEESVPLALFIYTSG